MDSRLEGDQREWIEQSEHVREVATGPCVANDTAGSNRLDLLKENEQTDTEDLTNTLVASEPQIKVQRYGHPSMPALFQLSFDTPPLTFASLSRT